MKFILIAFLTLMPQSNILNPFLKTKLAISPKLFIRFAPNFETYRSLLQRRLQDKKIIIYNKKWITTIFSLAYDRYLWNFFKFSIKVLFSYEIRNFYLKSAINLLIIINVIEINKRPCAAAGKRRTCVNTCVGNFENNSFSLFLKKLLFI